MFWTHIYDLIVKTGILFLSIIVFNNIPFLADKGILVVIASLIVSIIFYALFLRTLGSYLYCRLTLKMNVTFAQAKTLNAALSPSHFPFINLQWLPLKEVREIDDQEKYHVAIALIKKWEKEKIIQRQEQVERTKNNSATVRRLEILSTLLVIMSFATSFLNVPPATFVIKYYCTLFETEKYSPFFIGCIMTLICLVPIILIKRNLENKSS